MRIIALSADGKGAIRAGLQIEPKPGWITYWREPGGAGIPPSINAAPGTAFSVEDLSFPPPEVLLTGKLAEFVYRQPVTLPFRLQPVAPGAPAQRSVLTVFLGFCREICIPFQAELAVTPDPGQTPVPEALALSAAEARRPRKPDEDFKISALALAPDGLRLTLDILLPEPGMQPPRVIVTGPPGHAIFQPLKQERQGRNARIELSLEGVPARDRAAVKTWTALIVDGSKAIEAPLAFD